MTEGASTSWWRSGDFKSNLVSGLIIALVTAAISVPTTWITVTYFSDTQPEFVTYKLEYKNTSNTQQDNVVIAMHIPDGSEYVMGSTYIANSTTGSRWLSTDDGITGRGLNVGSYAAGGNVYLKFKVRPKGETTFTCSSNGNIGSLTVSTSSEIRAWITC